MTDNKGLKYMLDQPTHVINWNDVQVDPEGYFLVEPNCILERWEILLLILYIDLGTKHQSHQILINK